MTSMYLEPLQSIVNKGTFDLGFKVVQGSFNFLYKNKYM